MRIAITDRHLPTVDVAEASTVDGMKIVQGQDVVLMSYEQAEKLLLALDVMLSAIR